MDAAWSLFWIALVAVAAPLLSGLVPRRLVPEAVLLLAFGVVIGPHVLGLATMGRRSRPSASSAWGCCSCWRATRSSSRS
jgi:NhaP-type Na+/H+ or K+/H+ antiporter